MKRNPIGYQQDINRHTRKTAEMNGKLVRGGVKKGRRGVMGGGRTKGSGGR